MIKSKKKTSGWEKLKNQKGKAKKALTLIGSYRKRNANTLAMVSVSAKEGAKYDNIFEAAKEGDTPAVRYMYMDEGKSCKDPDELKGMTYVTHETLYQNCKSWRRFLTYLYTGLSSCTRVSSFKLPLFLHFLTHFHNIIYSLTTDLFTGLLPEDGTQLFVGC